MGYQADNGASVGTTGAGSALVPWYHWTMVSFAIFILWGAMGGKDDEYILYIYLYYIYIIIYII